MGYRFNIQHMNWLASLLEPGRPPHISDLGEFREALTDLQNHGRAMFMSSGRYELEFRHFVQMLLQELEDFPQQALSSEAYDDVLYYYTFLRDGWFRWEHFSRRFLERPWTAAILPGLGSDRLNWDLCDASLLRELVDLGPEHRGLILQPSQPPEGSLNLLDVCAPFRYATKRVHDWPALLVWDRWDTSLIPLGGGGLHGARHLLRDAIMCLNQSQNLVEFYDRFRPAPQASPELVHLLQISDVHLGSAEARSRSKHVISQVSQLRQGLGKRTIPILSGDLFDTPHQDLIEAGVDFVEDFERAVGERCFFVPGNHDWRSGGFGSSQPGPLAEVIAMEPVRHLKEWGISLVGFNSCELGEFARGGVSETQLLRRTELLSREPQLFRIGVVHHHPSPVANPDWHFRPWYERVFGRLHAPTVEMENGEALLNYCRSAKVSVLLHGHKHIPRYSDHNGVLVVGCGSAVGKIPTVDRRPYMSMNVITINVATKQVMVCFRADRTSAGFEDVSHEYIQTINLPRD